VTVCVFTGPTLSAAEARAVLDAVYLPPARQGDVYRAVQRHRPRVIGLVDGYFQDVPSVWHKEILWAMAEGVHLFGSASMGALRAAELAPFGMRGVGRIFEAFRAGRLPPDQDEPFEDDDEVAVVHRPAAAGFAALSEALVNIRATLAAAVESGVISSATRRTLVGIGKGLFYPDRSYEVLLERGESAAVPPAELEALRAWLPGGRKDQKRADALAMLREIRELASTDPGPARVAYVLQQSDMWRRAAESFEIGPGETVEGSAALAELVLDELRLDGPAYEEARRAAVLRLASLREGGEPSPPLDRAARTRAASLLRTRLGLADRPALERWLARHDLDAAAWSRLVEDETRLQALEHRWERSLREHLLAHLRLAGTYAAYAARARAKQRVVGDGAARSIDEWARFRLTAWYFEQRGGLEPEDVAIHAASRGFPDLDAFYRALWREHAFVTATEPPAGPPVSGDGPAPGAS
jgi:hypothetical protein